MKTVLITGASRGIGRGVAKKFAENGYNLVLTGNNSYEQLEKYADDLRSNYNISVHTFKANFENPIELDSLFSEIYSIVPKITIDILINNAGISSYGLFSDIDLNEYNRIMNVNLTSAIICAKKVLPNMLNLKAGKIINISSIWGEVGASMEVVYSTSKAGLNGFTKSLAKELAPSNIQVNAISCGLIDTDMNKCFSLQEIDSIIDEIPSNRMGSVDDVARLVFQMADTSSYLTGQVIRLDGGFI